MKFLCVGCDTQMRSVETRRQSGDQTMTVVLECPVCFSLFGMLTNPMETRLLDSLDVSVCPVGGKGREPSTREDGRELGPAAGEASPAPRAANVAPHAAEPTRDGDPAPSVAVRPAGAEAEGSEATGSKCPFGGVMELDAPAPADAAEVSWSAEAEARLRNVPSFVRPMARRGIEHFARERGCRTVTPELMDEARETLGA